MDLIEKLNNIRLNNDHILVSLDATSLFTNISINVAIRSISDRWDVISGKCNIPKKKFFRAIELILYLSFFTFNRVIYKQNFFTHMGSPLSPVIADLVMQDLENEALRESGTELPFYVRYVDNILLAINPESIEKF